MKTNSKKLRLMILALMLVCAIANAVFISILPDSVPMHYDFNGNIDRMGSKYEMLLFPGITLVMGTVFLLVSHHEQRKGGNSNDRVALYAGICILTFFTALNIFILVKTLDHSEGRGGADIYTFTCIGFGVLLILIGNIMPKARMNAAYGLRTTWSMANERVWQKSQRFGGITMVICGFLTIILTMLLPGIWSTIAFLALIIAAAVICIIASYRIYKADKETAATEAEDIEG